MPTYIPPKKNTELIFYISLVSQATPNTFQSSPTIAAGDFKVSIDGGALNNLSTLPAVTPAASKMVKVTLSTSEQNGDNITVIGSDAAGAEWCDIQINIQTSARQIDDLATSSALATVQADTDDIQTRLPAALTGAGNIKADAQVVSDKTGYALTSAYDPAQTAAQAGDAMTLTAAYDAAKTAATQTSVDDLPTNAELATALGDIPTAAENATEILSAADLDPITANIKKVNDVDITGTGTVGSDPWRKS